MPRSNRGTILAASVVIGLVAAGSATAGSLITGAAIKDETITSADLRNGSVQLRDLAPSVRKGIARASDPGSGRGPAGPRGPRGARGPAGSPGPAGGTTDGPAKPGVCTVQTFTGQGSAGIGDLSRSCESVVEWTSTPVGSSDFFSVRDDTLDLHISSSGTSGQSVEPAGVYSDVQVGTQDGSSWTITVRPA